MSDTFTVETQEFKRREFEDAVFGPILRGIISMPLDDEEREYHYMRIAMGPWCAEATTNARNFLPKKIGSLAVRMEDHENDMRHFFLSLSDSQTGIADSDIIIDPTYLQFCRSSNPDELLETHPKFFVGTRLAIVGLMKDPDFCGDNVSRSLYEAATLRSMQLD